MWKLLLSAFLCLCLANVFSHSIAPRYRRGIEEDDSEDWPDVDEGDEEAGGSDYHGQDYGGAEEHSHHEASQVTKVIPVHKILKVPVPQPFHHPFHVHYPIRVLEPYPLKIPVPELVEKKVIVPVEKVIEHPIEKQVPVKVVKKVPFPVPKPYPVPVPVYKTKYIHHFTKITKHH